MTIFARLLLLTCLQAQLIDVKKRQNIYILDFLLEGKIALKWIWKV